MTDTNKQMERGPAEIAGPAVTYTMPGKMHHQVLVIPGTLPGMNEYTDSNRGSKYGGGNMKRRAQATVEDYIRFTLRKLRFDSPVFLEYTFYERDRRRDHDNVTGFAHKVIQDALVKQHVISNDGWSEITGYIDFFDVDARHPRIEVRFIVQEPTRRRGKKC